MYFYPFMIIIILVQKQQNRMDKVQQQQQLLPYCISLEFVAPMVYLLNSIIDVLWAIKIQQRFKLKKKLSTTWSDWRIMLDDEEEEEEEENDENEITREKVKEKHGTFVEMVDRTTTTTTTTTTSASSPTNVTTKSHDDVTTISKNTTTSLPWYTKWRKHAAHRRTYMAALTFGIAAMASVLSVALYYFLPSQSTMGVDATTGASTWLPPLYVICEIISVHIYIISAIIAISGKRTRPWFHIPSFYNPETLEDLGDILFFIGSCVDGILLDYNFNNNNTNENDDSNVWSIFSAILWLVDACFYMKADSIMAHQLSEYRVPTGVNAGILV